MLLDVSGNYAKFVKTVYGGVEICKTSGRRHYQGHIHCRAPQRFAAIKKWLPQAHIEPARDISASIQYALKKDTAEGDKKAQVNPNPYMTDRLAMEKLVEQCLLICDCVYAGKDEKGEIRKDLLCHHDEKQDYWHRVRHILLIEPDLCGMYAKPDLFRLWKNTKSVWIARKRASIVLPSSLASAASANIILLDNINASRERSSLPTSHPSDPSGRTQEVQAPVQGAQGLQAPAQGDEVPWTETQDQNGGEAIFRLCNSE